MTQARKTADKKPTKKKPTASAARKTAPGATSGRRHEVEADLVTRLVKGPEDTDRAAAQARIVDTALDRAYLRGRIVDEIAAQRKSREWGPRGWLVGSLARIAGDDQRAGSVLIEQMQPGIEPEPFVRHWTLEGLWAGNSPLLEHVLERARQDEPVVALLAEAILAGRGDARATERLARALASPEPQVCWAALRALRVVPLPMFRDQVRAIEADPADKTLLWNARKALERMQGSTGASPSVVRSGTGDASPHGTAPAPAAEKDAFRSGTGDGFADASSPRVWIVLHDMSVADRGLLERGRAAIGREFEFQVSPSDKVDRLQEVERGDHLLVAIPEDRWLHLRGWGSVSGRVERGLKFVWRGVLGLNLGDVRPALPGLAHFRDGGPITPVDRREWTVIRELIAIRSGSPPDLPGVPPEPFVDVEFVAVEHAPATVRPGHELRARLELRNTGSVTWALGASLAIEASMRRPGHTPMTWTVKRSFAESVPPGSSTSLAAPIQAPDDPGSYQATYAVTSETWGSSRFLTGPVPLSVEAEDASRNPSGLGKTGEPDLASNVGSKLPRPVHPALAGTSRVAPENLAGQGLPDAEIPNIAPAALHSLAQQTPQEAARQVADDTVQQVAEELEQLAVQEPSQRTPLGGVTLPAETENVAEFDAAQVVGAERTAGRASTAGAAADPRAVVGRPAEREAATNPAATEPAVVSGLVPAMPAVPTGVYIIRELYRAPEAANRLVLSVSDEMATIDFDGKSYESYLTPEIEQLKEELIQAKALPLDYGHTLFRAVINDHVRRPSDGSTLFGFHKAVETTGGKLAIELKLDSDELFGLAWERLSESPEGPPLATRESAPFYRRVGNAEVEAARPPLKILVAICNPTGLPRLAEKLKRDLPALDVAEEREFFERGLARLREEGLVEYEILGLDATRPATLQQIADRLQEGPHVLHLLAHGLFVEGQYCLAIERDGGKLPVVKAQDLALPMTNWKVRLAVLEACQSGQVPEDATSGPALGTQLVRAGLPAVISMQEKLGVKSAQYFNHRFYHHLARSGRVEMALAATRHDLFAWGRDEPSSWSIPVLHLGAATGALFEVDEHRAARLPDERPRVLGRDELDRLGRKSHGKIEEALRAADRTGVLEPAQIATLSQAISASLAPREAAAPHAPLAVPQNREALQGWMDRPVEIRADDLAAWVVEKTGLRYPRTFYLQAASALNAGKHLVLIGPPGTGKTTVAHAMCDYAAERHFCRGKIPTTASADWTTFDTVGGYVPTSADRLEFRPGLFLQAIATGRWLVLDEINRAEIDKAVGELFTVLSGQRVDLPYRVEGQPVRILPFADAHPAQWVPAEATGDYDYVVHPSWRTLATMNVYDRSSLFGMSFAFMRRFAFVDVGVPDEETIFAPLRSRWIDQGALALARGVAGPDDGDDPVAALKARLSALFQVGSPLMHYRELGPAIAKDMIRYTIDRARQEERPDLVVLLAEAFLLYAVPQLDGLTREAIVDVYGYLTQLFPGQAGEPLSARIRVLYPHVSRAEWPDAAAGPGERENGADL